MAGGPAAGSWLAVARRLCGGLFRCAGWRRGGGCRVRLRAALEEAAQVGDREDQAYHQDCSQQAADEPAHGTRLPAGLVFVLVLVVIALVDGGTGGGREVTRRAGPRCRSTRPQPAHCRAGACRGAAVVVSGVALVVAGVVVVGPQGDLRCRGGCGQRGCHVQPRGARCPPGRAGAPSGVPRFPAVRSWGPWRPGGLPARGCGSGCGSPLRPPPAAPLRAPSGAVRGPGEGADVGRDGTPAGGTAGGRRPLAGCRLGLRRS